MKKGFKALISVLSLPLAITLFSKEAKADVARSVDGTSFVNAELVAENNQIVLDKLVLDDKIKVEDVATINFLSANYVEIYDKGNNRYEGELLTKVQFRQGKCIRGMEGIKQYAVTNGVMAQV